MKEEVIVIYSRPWFEDYYNYLAEQFSIAFRCKVLLISDYSIVDGENLSPLKEEIIDQDITKNLGLQPIESYINDIIARDRLLRDLDYEYSFKVISAYQSKIKKFISNKKIKFFFSATVDQFFVDLLFLNACINKIPFLGYHISVVPGYLLFSSRGEINPFRKVDDKEVSAAAEKIANPNFRPNYIPSKNKIILTGALNLFKNILRVYYYKIRNFASKRFNYHFLHNSKNSYFINKFLGLVYQHSIKESQSLNHDLYIPLQLHPECNSDYWPRFKHYSSYEDFILNLIKGLHSSVKVVLKEHPNMIGYREVSFYRNLKQLGAEIVHVEHSNAELINSSKSVLTLNSSVGIEGLIYNKPIICLSDPYYKSNFHYSSYEPQLFKDYDANKALKLSVRNTLQCSHLGTIPDTNYLYKKSSKKKIYNETQQLICTLKSFLKNYHFPNLKNIYTIE